jgi:hemolysin activation/secretion protein
MNSFGLGLNGNVAFTGGESTWQAVANSKQASGYYFVAAPSYTRTLELVTNWVTTVRADGQWASQPLISNEQYGIGGVNSVRGYQEGQVFGDNGWHVTVQQDTPAHRVGYVSSRDPLTIRGSIYMDYADVYLIDPQGRPGSTALWGTGIGFVAAVGSQWQARFLFSEPLLSVVGGTAAYDPFFNFALTAQF